MYRFPHLGGGHSRHAQVEGLPSAASNYLEHISAVAGVPVRLVSVGLERDQIILAP
jgi:adenylosuccinate synthase